MNWHKHRHYNFFLLVTGFIGFFSLFQLLSIPPDPKNNIFLGFSFTRLAMVSIILLVIGVSLGLALFNIRIKEKLFFQMDRYLKDSSFFWTIFIICFLFSISGLNFLQSTNYFGLQEAIYIRLRPLVQLGSLISLAAILSLAWSKKPSIQSFFHELKQFQISFLPHYLSLQPRKMFVLISINICLIIGMLIIGLTISQLPLHQVGYWLFYEQPWLIHGGVIYVVLFLVVILFYNQNLLKWMSALSIMIMLGGAIYNINNFSRINWYSSPGLPLERLHSNRLFDLLYKNEIYQVMNYSFYAILAEYYPQYNLISDSELIADVKISEVQLKRFGHIQSIKTTPLTPLSDLQADYLKSIAQIDEKIIMGDNIPLINFYFILPEQALDKDKTIIIRRLDKKNVFIYPSRIEQSLP